MATTNQTKTIDNGFKSLKWTIAYGVTFAVAVALMLYSHFHRTDYIACFTIAGILLLAHVLFLLVNPSYFYFSDEGKNIVIRNVSDYPLFRKYNEFPFPKSSLMSYKIDKSMFGFKKLLSLKVRGIDPETKKPKEFDITKINISSIDKQEYADLVKALDKVISK